MFSMEYLVLLRKLKEDFDMKNVVVVNGRGKNYKIVG